ncbi:MAG TPA: histidinol-phosphatase, partial [Kribbella sp.]|nr:histidinol-phosphatase [Kribbella sp.]
MSDATASGHDDGHGHAHGHGHGHGHDHEHGRIARWLGGLHGRVTRREGSRLNRAQVIGLRVAAIAIRTVA